MSTGRTSRDGQPAERILRETPQASPGSPSSAQLIDSCRGLVRALAWQIHRKLPPSMDMDDLLGFGYVGLVEAARDFDPSQGSKFVTYAYYRIRGAILDGLSKMSWFSPHDYHSSRYQRMANEVVQVDVEEDPGLEPDSLESDDLQGRARWFRGAATRLAIVHLATPRGPGDEAEPLDLADTSTPSPQAQAMEVEMRQKLHQLIEALPSESGNLVRALYFEGLTLEEAGKRLGISKAWASRLHAKTLGRLARALRRLGITEA